MASEWPTCRIEQLAAAADGSIAIGPFGSRMKAECYVDEGVAIIRGTNLGQGRFLSGEFVFITPRKARELGNANLKPNDLVFPHRGAIGEVGIVPEDGRRYALSTSLMKISLDDDRAVPDFLYYFFRSPAGRAELLKNASQVGTPGIATPLKSLRECVVPCPSVRQQRDSADVLRCLDDRIDNLRQTNATLEAIAQALFKSWFVDFDPVRAKAEGREPEGMDAATAALFPSEFEGSELGPIPKGWRTSRVSNVADIVKGRSYKSAELQDSDTALVTLKSFNRGGGFRRDGFKPYVGPFKDEQLLREGECIVAFTDVTQQAEIVGRSAIVTGSRDYAALVASLDVGIVRPKVPTLTAGFLGALLSGDRYVSHIKGFVTGTTVLHLAKDGLPSFLFVMPPQPLIQRWTSIADACFKRKALNEHRAESLCRLRDTLLPRLISGKLRLPEAESVIKESVA